MSYRHLAVLSAVLVIGCSTLTTAQVRWGAHAGVNYANLDIENDVVIATNNIVGYVAGLRAEYQITPALSAYLSPQYVLKGSDVEAGVMVGEYQEFTSRQKYHYLEIPLGLRLRLPVSGVKPYILGGIGVAPLLSSTYSLQESSMGSIEEESEEDGKKYTTDMDVVFHTGIGAEMPLSQTTALTFDIRYSRSLQTIDDSDFEGYVPAPVYTSDIMLVVGVLFR